MKTPAWREEDWQQLPVIEDIAQWQELVEYSRRTETDITDLHVRHLTAEQPNWDHMGFSRVWFDDCRFTGVSISQASFYHVRFEGGDLSGGDIRRSHFRQCEFRKAKGVGLIVSDSFFRRVRFSDWNGRYMQWATCELEQVDWINADCREALFSDCPLKTVRFDHTALQQTQFFKTYLKGIDLTSCDIDGLSVSERMTELQGAVVDLYQAAELARMLGIIIR